jgi:5-methylcytosine-specific restriction protein A
LRFTGRRIPHRKKERHHDMEEIEDIIASAEEDAGDVFDDEDVRGDTWTTEGETCVVKKTDRHVFLYRETVLPEKIQAFFSLADLLPGKKRKIVLWQEHHRFDAFIEKTLHDPPLTRLRWEKEFGSQIQNTYPEWFDFFKKSRDESDDTPLLFFTRRQGAGEYDVAFDRAPAQDPKADAEVPVMPGDVIDNEHLREIFRCSSQGAMRRSLVTNRVVLIADHTRPACDDKWIGKTFHFTGMGLTGEQGLSFNQNKALCESNEKGTRLFLFEVFEEGSYTFIGEVELALNPYLSRQTDGENTVRDVTVFPLILKGNAHPPFRKKAALETKKEIALKKAQKLPLDELEFQAKYSLKEGGRREVVTEVFDGDQIVAEYAKRKAAGTCQLCNKPAPFKNRDGEPYLEVHHIIPLEEGGQDSIENVVALCPNCHRKMHVLNLPADEVRLKNRVSVRD